VALVCGVKWKNGWLNRRRTKKKARTKMRGGGKRGGHSPRTANMNNIRQNRTGVAGFLKCLCLKKKTS